jgi:hypothetical protein
MRTTLLALSILAFSGGVWSFSVGQTGVPELHASLMVVVAAILVSAAAVVDAFTRALKRTESMGDTLTKVSSALQALTETRHAETSAKPSSEPPAYWVRLENDSNGPFPLSKLRELRKRGAIDDDTPVAREGEKEWKKTREIIGTA